MVSPAAEGTAWIDGRDAHYRAPAGFVGTDSFTFAARDGMTDSNLGEVTMTVSQASCTLECSSAVPDNAPVASAVHFVGEATAIGCQNAAAIAWDFGDGTVGQGADVTHSYAATGRYDWSMTATADGVSCSRDGSILVSATGAQEWSQSTVAARAPGAAGSSWRSDLVLANPGSSAADVTLIFRPDGGTATATVSLPAGSTGEWSDVLQSLLGVTGEASGALEIVSSQPITATVRTFNTDPNGTFGQFFPAVDGAAGLTPARPGIVPHLKRDTGSRTNMGFLNLGDQSATVNVTVFGATGQQLGNPISRTVPARQWVQINDVIGRTGNTTETLAWATVEVATPGASVWVYASVISNDSGDPITVPVMTPQ